MVLAWQAESRNVCGARNRKTRKQLDGARAVRTRLRANNSQVSACVCVCMWQIFSPNVVVVVSRNERAAGFLFPLLSARQTSNLYNVHCTTTLTTSRAYWGMVISMVRFGIKHSILYEVAIRFEVRPERTTHTMNWNVEHFNISKQHSNKTHRTIFNNSIII